MPEALSFCLARAQRPLLHVDRNAHLSGDRSILSAIPDQQQLSQGLTNLQTGCWPGFTAGVTPRLELVKDKSTLYLGETCVFYITLSNQGNSQASAIAIKVECSVEGGSNTVLYDNTQDPLQQLPAAGRHDVIVQTDIKEPGVITIVASAVYTARTTITFHIIERQLAGHSRHPLSLCQGVELTITSGLELTADQFGERKYHVQFFKFHSTSPLSVKTRVRCLPHVQQQPPPTATHDSSSNAMEAQQLLQSSGSKAYCFLEVSVDNSTPLPLVLHAVNLLTSTGLSAQQLTSHMWQQQQQRPGQWQQQQQQMPNGPQQHDVASKRVAGDSSKRAAVNTNSNDTRLQHDVEDTSSDRDNSAAAAAVHAGSAAHDGIQLLQQSTQAAATQQQQPGPDAVELGPLLAGQPPLVVLPPGGGSHNYLWQIHQQQQQQHRISSSDGSSWSGAFLGRLELHWSTVDGKTGRLLTQPLSRPITTAAGRDVLMQLTHLLPAAATLPSHQQQPFLDHLEVGVPVRAVFSLTAAAGLQQQQNVVGPLLVLHTELSPFGPSTAANNASNGRLSDSSSSKQRQQQGGTTSGIRAEAAGSENWPGSSGSRSDSSRLHPAVAVQGKRSVRVSTLSAGDVVTVEFLLLPLIRGWVKLPTFVVVSEADRRLLDGVHDVRVLVW